MRPTEQAGELGGRREHRRWRRNRRPRAEGLRASARVGQLSLELRLYCPSVGSLASLDAQVRHKSWGMGQWK